MSKNGELDDLAARIAGDVHGDLLHRRLVAQDASPYRVLPAALVCPRDADDCAAVVAFARERGLGVIPRGGGTSLAGQCVGSGIVVDTSRYMTAVEAVDPEAGTVRVQPGRTASQLDRALAPYGLVLGPDPSTADRATLAGMVGNNAWGPHAPVDGSTRDQLVAATAIGADACPMRLAAEGGTAGDGERRAALAALAERHAPALAAAPGGTEPGLCRNSGYALHALDPGRPNEATVLAGAEGTLGLVTSLELNVRPPLPAGRLLCPHFTDLRAALTAVAPAVAAGARAVELLDRQVLALTRDHPAQAGNRFWLEGDPAAVLLVELPVGADAGALVAALRAGGAVAVPEVAAADAGRVWALRRAGLGLLMGRAGARKAVSGLEDTAVPVARLPAYIDAVDRLVAAEGTECVHYGSVALGLVHLRPLLDLGDAGDRARYRRLLDGVAALVREHGGAWSTKHGDGRLRAPWLEAVMGSDWLAAMRALKALYDPEGLFNPGKILDAPDPLEDLRATAARATDVGGEGLDWRGDGGLAAAAARCHGAGACRRAAGEGGMCPTYQATREELHGTRGRANLFQQAFEAGDPGAALAGDDLHAALSLCLSCKACQHECPARVDVARLKAEHLYQRHRRRGMPLAARAIAAFPALSAVAARAPRLANAAGRNRVLQHLLGLGRAPPLLARQSLPAWLRVRAPAAGAGRPPVIVLLDPYTAWYEPAVGRAAVGVLERLGYAVHVSCCTSTGRAAISQGALERARRELADSVAAISAAGPADAPVVGLEPSELLTLRDEAAALAAPGERAAVEALAARALLLEEFLAGAGADALAAAGDGAAGAPRRVALHVHCHAKALAGTGPMRQCLEALPGHAVEPIEAGCCGMAGAFGYRRETAEVSRAVAELALAPAVRALPPETVVAAPGASCRQQVRATTGREAVHPVEVIAGALGVAY